MWRRQKNQRAQAPHSCKHDGAAAVNGGALGGHSGPCRCQGVTGEAALALCVSQDPLLWMAATRALGPVENPLLCCNPAMERRVLSDKQWALMAPHCLGKPGDAGPRGTDSRLFVEAVLWIVRTGSPWRDLPEEFGKCNTVFKRFRDWVKADIWQKLFDAVSGQPDMQYAMVDATIVKVHRHGQGAGLKARP